MKKLLVKFNDEIIAQTQGSDDELAVWLVGDSFKYPEGYLVEYIDLDEDPEFQLQQVIANRKAEYPSAEDFLNAFFDGGDAGIEELRQKRLAIKAKYPKP